MASRKPAKRKILMPVGTPSVSFEEIRRAVQNVKAKREARERSEHATKKGENRGVSSPTKPKRKIPKPVGTPSFSLEEAKRVIDRILAAET